VPAWLRALVTVPVVVLAVTGFAFGLMAAPAKSSVQAMLERNQSALDGQRQQRTADAATAAEAKKRAKEEAERLIEGVPDDLIVLFDEAYFQFNTDPDASVAMDLFDAHPNVAVAHTFSKAYGLAGLRIGYCIAHEDVISEMMKARLPFSVTDMAQVAAVASMDAQDELDERVRAIVAERGRVVDAIRAMGWFLPEPEGNFFWVPLREQTAQAAQAFDEAKISVRVTPGEGLRITIGSKEANDAVIAVFEALNAQGVRSVR